MKRLGGKLVLDSDFKVSDSLYLHQFNSMSEAASYIDEAHALPHYRRIRNKAEVRLRDTQILQKEIMEGDGTYDKTLDLANELIEEAIARDNRLIKKSSWVRSEFGEEACPSLLASGDPNPCYEFKPTGVKGQAGGDAIRIVISTDSSDITHKKAAALIAAIKLAQQFRPLEVWWQGSWLREDSLAYNEKGLAFMVPLIRGDMDFSRLEFVIGNIYRDSASYRIMFNYAHKVRKIWGGGVATRSFLNDTFDFVSELGIEPTAFTVANLAANWAGFESSYINHIYQNQVSQHWKPDKTKLQQINEAARSARLMEKCKDEWSKEHDKTKMAYAKNARQRGNNDIAIGVEEV